MSSSRTDELSNLIKSSTSVETVAELFDEMDHRARVAATRRLDRQTMGALFGLAERTPSRFSGGTSLETLVPAAVPPMTEVIHDGFNSLPALRTFCKVFCRPGAGSRQAELWGYNRVESPWPMLTPWLAQFSGPGYFIASQQDGQLLFDYTRLPPRKLSGWPAISSNDVRLARIVYGGMLDIVKPVGRHVMVGRVWRNGRIKDQWFVLCRRPTPKGLDACTVRDAESNGFVTR